MNNKLLNSKKGFFMSFRDWLSFFVGLILFAIGLIPLLSSFKVIKWGLPGFMTSLIGSIFFWIIAIAGIYIFIDGIIEPKAEFLHLTLLLVGLLFVAVGLIPILHKFGVVGFGIPFLDNMVVYNIIITIEGLLLMTAGFTMR
jgi:hypothetical protein